MTVTTSAIATSRRTLLGPIGRYLALAALAMIGAFAQAEEGSDEPVMVEEIVVSGELTARMGEIGSWSAVDAEELDLIGATHPTEALVRVPGVWISRGSGQEHLTAIRSAVLTGAGACGEFLYLENGLPVRPAGFCNVNNLFELNTEQAGRIEVWRGPASAVLGGNALHGAINVINRLPEQNRIGIEGGSYGSYRASGEFNVQTENHRFAGTLFGSGTEGYRDDTGHDQQKLSLVHQTMAGGFEVENTLNYTNLEQETGAFVNGFKAYEDGDLRKTNPAPEAYRDAWSVRIASRWARETWHFTPYLRSSDMEFLQHFLPGQPRERNDQTSGGVVFGFTPVSREDLAFSVGAQIEYMSGHLDQWQAEPLTDSTPFNNAVRPQGWQYDYDVDSFLAAGYYNLAWAFAEKTRLVHSLRLEYLEYDYKNLMLDGNTRDDGTACGFGGCLYNRPESRKDDFTNVAGRLGVEQDIGDGVGYITFGSGFRPPQATELYRLQRGQDVADLKSEELVSLEIGYRGGWWNVAGFAENTDNFIFRDGAGFNVSDGKTKAWGIEAEAFRTWGNHTFGISGTYAEHKYDFDSSLTGRETIEKGNYMDTAPKWLANGRWGWTPVSWFTSELELNYLGKHYVNAANTAEYKGHLVANLRMQARVNDAVALHARIINLTDEQYADRADFTEFTAEGYRYFPAMPRQFYVGATFSF
ncbi:MAG: TonB-dependent receptor [Gammaproteobacteria bacterium]|nr:MAG: TonB-dependent receptor [Gammaproteobacteria bacterium]